MVIQKASEQLLCFVESSKTGFAGFCGEPVFV